MLKDTTAEAKVSDKTLYTIVDHYLQLIADNRIKDMACDLNISIARAQEYSNFDSRNSNYIVPKAYVENKGKLKNAMYFVKGIEQRNATI